MVAADGEPVNPGGTASFGVVILKDDSILYQGTGLFRPQPGRENETSNNVAEYSGFLDILKFLIGMDLTGEEILIQGDSMLVIKQMRGEWRMRHGFYIPIAKECKELLKKFTNIRLSWIPREQNTFADKLSKAELQKAGIQFRIQPE